jgi:hypothetical protein
MNQAVSHMRVIVRDRVRSKVSPCAVYDGQCGTGTSFLPSTVVRPYPPVLYPQFQLSAGYTAAGNKIGKLNK